MKCWLKLTMISMLMWSALPITSAAAEKLKVGDLAPRFTLPFATKDTISLGGLDISRAIGTRNIVLAFYPANWSGGCTRQMCALRDNLNELAELGAEVYGISGDYVYSHHEWAKHHDFQFTLLSDHQHEVARAYESFNDLTGFNKRTIYVIDRKGHIAYIDPAFKAGSVESLELLKKALTIIK